MKLTNYFASFLEDTVNLTDAKITLLSDRVSAITSFLSGHDVFGEYFIDVIPQGSYSHRTIITPIGGREYDADVLLALEEHPLWTPADYTLELRRAFNGSGIYKDMAHMRTRCVFVDYADPFHVDVVPFVVVRSSITNNKGGVNGEGCWQLSYPEDFTAWLESKYRIVGGGRLPAALRLLKYLRDSKGTFSIKSVILTILVGEVVQPSKTWLDDTYYADLPTVLVHLLEDLNAYLLANPWLPSIGDPAGSGTKFSERWDQDGYANFRKWIDYYATKAREAYDATTVEASLTAWQAMFGPSFTKPATKTLVAAASAAAPAEEFIDQTLRIPVHLSETVQLIGRVRGIGVRKPYDLPHRGDVVGKFRKIDFRLENCTVAAPYDVYWKVRNHGPEAAQASDLRGQMVRSGTTKEEHTKYAGSHYVEVHIVKNGVCVAKDRQPVIVRDGL